MRAARAAAAPLMAAVAIACSAQDIRVGQERGRAPYLGTDSMGVAPQSLTVIRLQARPELEENSAATASATQPGVFFTVNDSGNDPWLFAFDSTGADRGVWRVAGAPNVDWEAASTGPCSAPATTDGVAARQCVYIGDTGDNSAERPSRVIYKVVEPVAEHAGFTGDVAAAALAYRYSDGPHDVEAMYAAPNGDVYLITKRALRDAAGKRRPALVFVLPADAWRQESAAVAQLVDSLPIVPGSAPMRQITDAALSPDARHVAVRTYAQVYVFAADPATGRVRTAIPPSVCNIVTVELRPAGEGVAWFGRSGKLLLTSEGRKSPLSVIGCPLPRE